MVTGAGVAGADPVLVTVTVGMGEVDAMTVGDVLAVGDAVTVGDALWVTFTGADVVGVTVAGADVVGVTVAGADVEADTEVVGVAVAGDIVCTEPLVSATPVKVHPASSPTESDTTASGRQARRRACRAGWPGTGSPRRTAPP